MLKTYVTVLSGETRDWDGMLPLIPVGYTLHRRGVKLLVTASHITLEDDPDADEGGTAAQFVSVEPIG